jgi:hypothetical protein
MIEDSIAGLQPKYQTYDRRKCFVAYSEQAPWAVDLLGACEEILSQPAYNLEIDYARKHFAADVPLRQKALELIANAHYGIYDLSYWRENERSLWQMPRNVMIELGIAIALNRPILLLRHASNRDLPLPNILQGLSDRILEFSGTTTLKKVLTEHLTEWINTPPGIAWWNRHCTFGGRVCEYREAHPKVKQLDKKALNCAIADGSDFSCSDFRTVVEDVLERFDDVACTYLDSLLLEEGYSFSLCTHCQIVRSSPFAIYRITSQTPAEVLISIGMSLAVETQFEYKIPKILITEDIQNIPSLLSGYEVVIVQSDKDTKFTLKRLMPIVIQKTRKTTWKQRILPFIENSHLLIPKSELDNSLLESNLEQETEILGETEESSNSLSLVGAQDQALSKEEKSATSSLRATRKLLDLNLSPEAYKLLLEISKESGTTMSEVIRTSLALYEIAHEESKKGNSLGFVEDGKVVRTIVIAG